MLHTMLHLLFVSLLAQSSLAIPVKVKQLLDQHFSNWKLIQFSDTIYRNKARDIDENGRTFFTCFLNRDTIPDFALEVIVKKDTLITAYFLALVSNDTSYTLFTLAAIPNPKPLTLYLYLYPKGTRITNCGFADEDNLPQNLSKAQETFDTDCISLISTEHNMCRTFVYASDRFWEFEACD